MVHHPVHLLQRQGNPKIPAQPAHRLALAAGIGDARHDRVEQSLRRSVVARGKQAVQPQVPLYTAIGLVDAGDDTLLFPQRAQVRAQPRPLRQLRCAAPGLDRFPGHRVGRKQPRLPLVRLLGLEKLAQLPKERQFRFVGRSPDMAHDAPADLTIDQLHGLARAVGRGFSANEHGGGVPHLAREAKYMNLLGTTNRVPEARLENPRNISKMRKTKPQSGH